MDFKLVKNYSGRGKETIRLYDNIGVYVDSNGWFAGISGTDFARDLFWLQTDGITKEVDILINSSGGLVLDTWSIIASILSAQAAGLIINTINDGVAASCAGLIFQVGNKRLMRDYALFMAHNPSSPEESIDSAFMQKIKDSLLTIFEARAGIAPDKMSAIMDVETWLRADEAIAAGFADEIISTGRTVELAENRDPKKLALIFNQYINTNSDMKKIAKVLNLNEAATEEQVVETTESILAENKRLKDENEQLKKDALAEAEKAAEKAAETLVDGALAAGKITAENKAGFVALAKNNFDTTKAILDGMGSSKQAPRAAGLINQAGGQTQEDEEEKLGFNALSQKNPKRLEEIRNQDPEKFKRMLQKQYPSAVK